jgi:hypothetical protein
MQTIFKTDGRMKKMLKLWFDRELFWELQNDELSFYIKIRIPSFNLVVRENHYTIVLKKWCINGKHFYITLLGILHIK